MLIEEIIEKFTQEVEGEKGAEENILLFTLSTCMWCKKGKNFLNDRKMKYRYIDMDKIDPKDKAKIINYLKDKYHTRVSYPFLVCESGYVVGYNPNKYDELFKNGGA